MTTTETITPGDAIRANVPTELLDLAQWVVWKFEQRDGKPTKVLYNPATGARADSTEPRTWGTFDDAVRADERGGYNGLGFVVTEHDPYTGVDLDHCIVDGQLTDDANRWLLLLNSYTEITPSGVGVRVWVKAKKPGQRCKNAKLGVEIYESERFFTVTGNRLVDLPTTINDRQTELEALYNEVFPPPDKPANDTQSEPSVAVLSMDDQELVKRMLRKNARVQALWDGDTSGHANDHSGSDLALCSELAYYTNKDSDRIDRLFRQSGLYRPKWDRKDYRDRTITKAMDGTKGNYDPANYRSNNNMGKDKAASDATQTTPAGKDVLKSGWVVGNEPQPVKKVWSVADLLATQFPDPVWAVPGLLPAGLVVLAGRPKLGKSWLALQMAVAVGTGGMVLGRKVEQGKVLYLALEDNPRRLQDRLGKQLAPAATSVDFHFEWPALVERGGANRGTEALKTTIAAGGYKLVVVDTISRALGHADQLDQSDMNAAFGALQRMAIENDVCLLLVDHHRKNAGGAGDVIDDVMGATSKVGVADAAIGIYRQRGQKEARLKVAGRDVEDQELVIDFDGELFSWQLVGNADDVRADSMAADILLALEEMGGSATVTKLARWLGKQAPNVARELAELVARGKVAKGEKTGREQPYQLPHTHRISDDNNDNNDNSDKNDNYDNYHWSDGQ